MPVIVCPHCKTGSDFAIQGNYEDKTKLNVLAAVGSCRLCERVVFFELAKGNPQTVISSYLRWTPKFGQVAK